MDNIIKCSFHFTVLKRRRFCEEEDGHEGDLIICSCTPDVGEPFPVMLKVFDETDEEEIGIDESIHCLMKEVRNENIIQHELTNSIAGMMREVVPEEFDVGHTFSIALDLEDEEYIDDDDWFRDMHNFLIAKPSKDEFFDELHEVQSAYDAQILKDKIRSDERNVRRSSGL